MPSTKKSKVVKPTHSDVKEEKIITLEDLLANRDIFIKIIKFLSHEERMSVLFVYALVSHRANDSVMNLWFSLLKHPKHLTYFLLETTGDFDGYIRIKKFMDSKLRFKLASYYKDRAESLGDDDREDNKHYAYACWAVLTDDVMQLDVAKLIEAIEYLVKLNESRIMPLAQSVIKSTHCLLNNSSSYVKRYSDDESVRDLKSKIDSHFVDQITGRLAYAFLNLEKIDLQEISTYDSQGLDLRYANLKGACLSGVKLSYNLNMRGADLRGAKMMECEYRFAVLRDAVLRGANISTSYFGCAILRDVDLRDTIIHECRFENAILKGADLRGADLRDTILQNCKFVNADLRGADLRDVDMSTSDFSGADLRGADLRDNQKTPESFRRAKLYGAILDGADFSGRDISGSTFLDADFKIDVPGLIYFLSYMDKHLNNESRKEVIFENIRCNIRGIGTGGIRHYSDEEKIALLEAAKVHPFFAGHVKGHEVEKSIKNVASQVGIFKTQHVKLLEKEIKEIEAEMAPKHPGPGKK